MARLASIHRYPVKGFAGQELAASDLQAGRGIAFDRALGVPNGTMAVVGNNEWTPCQAFVRLTKNADLLTFDMRFDELCKVATLRAPNGQTATIKLGSSLEDTDEVAQTLAGWFGPAARTGPHDRTGGNDTAPGYWDHEDAPLSLINLETVALLSRVAGRPIDPLRFRANFYITDLPALAEVGFIGRTIRVGDAVLEVLRPIDRCRATSIDPATSDASLNVPTLLSRSLGHVYCGVYARVVEGAKVRAGSPLYDFGPALNAARDGTRVKTAPPAADWPRAACVSSREQESSEVVSFWLDDPLALLRPVVQAGQHLRVHLADVAGAPVWRAYTISGIDGTRLRISVKRDGVLSTHLHKNVAPGDSLHITGPFGHVVLPPASTVPKPLLMMSAGIGITPTVAMLRELAGTNDARSVLVIHVARDESQIELWSEVRDLVGRLVGARAHLHLTRASKDVCTIQDATSGRPDVAMLTAQFERAHADAFVCGPPTFLREAIASLLALGIDPERLQAEMFASPGASGANSRVDCSRLRADKPRRVRFAASRTDTIWSPNSGSLLDLAEANGLAPSANCRSGACGVCTTRLLAGTILHEVKPMLPPRPGHVLLCCAVPRSDDPSDLVIDL